jgi:hypothetical protein
MQDDIVEFRHSQKNYRVKSFQGYVYSGVMYVLMMVFLVMCHYGTQNPITLKRKLIFEFSRQCQMVVALVALSCLK